MLASRQTALSLLQGSRALCGIPQRGLAARGTAPCAPAAAASVLAGCRLPAATASHLPVAVDPCQRGWSTRPHVGQPVPPSLSALLRYSSLCQPTFEWQGGYHHLSPRPHAWLSRTSWGCSYAGCVIPPLQLSQFHSCRLQKPAMLTQSSRSCAVPEHRHPVSKTVSVMP